MVNLSMSRSAARAPLLVTVGLALATTAVPLAAQRTEISVRRAPRTTSADTLDQQLRRMQRSIDSLVRLFDDDDLNAAERYRVGQQIDQRIAEFRAQRMRLEGEMSRLGVSGPFVRALPGPGFRPPPMLQEAMATGWVGIVVSGAPREMRIDGKEMKMRFL